ncbi:P-loop containing nucleoside triphosphate hydrolase protein [Lanmaoa asiatica]|nr:P-loop containing nucleoside triphosphate hydrolase protein [Lanmaoa asiatica]
MHHDPPPAYDSQVSNVIIFGETGTGKSSVVNLIAGSKVAKTSPDAGGCTFASDAYHVVLQSNQPFCIWDTIGLNEPDISRADYLRAIKQAYKLIKELERSGGVHLLLLCMRGRITKSVQQNYRLFVKVLCEKEVPFGVVITNLENERCMEEWWTTNKKVFEDYGISADGHACITASPGVGDIFLGRYEESRESMRKLLLELTLSTGKGWMKEKRTWFADLLKKMAKMLSPQHGRFDHPTDKELMKKLVNECGFSRKDAVVIANSIIEAIRDQTPAETSDGGPL